jgi:hypothetical protein
MFCGRAKTALVRRVTNPGGGAFPGASTVTSSIIIQMTPELERILGITAQTSFREVAALPAILLILFAAIWVYDRCQGGYRGEKLVRALSIQIGDMINSDPGEGVVVRRDQLSKTKVRQTELGYLKPMPSEARSWNSSSEFLPRYPNMLRFVVERSLGGQTEHLKERTLGVEVFGRDPAYDTNSDPVVRVTAGEIRKRIAQYYHEPGHEAEIRIDFPPGSYWPEFRIPHAPALELSPSVAAPPQHRRAPVVRIAFLVCALALTGWIATRLWNPRPALDRFWAPVLNSSEPVMLYIGGYPIDAPPNPPVSFTELQQAETVAFGDATALARVTSLLVSNHKSYRIRLQTSEKVDDLRDGPAVLIGAFNNSWTLRLTSQLRFSFGRNPDTHLRWIRDRENPASLQWSHAMSAPYASFQEDYAIVSRVWDPTTGRVVVTAAGLTKFGTAAAGEFLTNPSNMDEIGRQAPRNWDRKNIEIVIATSIVGRSSGPSHIVAVHAW